MVNLQLPKYTEEEALGLILSHLRNPGQGNPLDSIPNYDLYIPHVMAAAFTPLHDEWRRQNPGVGMVTFSSDLVTNSEPFYDAAWSLCTRGILRPAPVHPGRQPEYMPVIGGGYYLTPYGKAWLDQASGYETIPSQYGRFAQLLATHSNQFGGGYHARSQEAVSCYRAHTYLACCAMCGAAAESILLALAIDKTGDEDRVLRDYRTNTGRTKLENLLLSQASSHIKREFPNYLDLLKYWRDESAHGERTAIGEGEAFTSLLLLLRFAQFAHDRWNELMK